MGMRTIFLAVLLAASAVAVRAEERVTSFEAKIVVSREGAVAVTEAIEISADDDRFRNGINRDLDLARGTGPVTISSVTLDGDPADFREEDRDGIRRIRIGSGDKPLTRGTHRVELAYEVESGIVEAGDDDMLSWDAAGTWEVPIDSVSATIKLPTGVRIIGIETLAGTQDRPRDDLQTKEKGGALNFSTRGGLDAGERLVIKLRFPRDAIGPADEQ